MRKSHLVLFVLGLCASASAAATLNPWQPGPLTPPQQKDLYLRNPSITLAPAESIHSFNVLHYDLDIDFAMDSDYLSGFSTVMCESRTAGLDSLTLNCVDLSVDSVLLEGRQLSYNLLGGNILIDLDTSFQMYDTFAVKVAYNGNPTSGYYWFTDPGTTPETTAFTSTEPSDSRYWFPCFDEPWDKADMGCQMKAQVPIEFVVASNGLLTSVDTIGGTHVSYTWQEENAIATYLMSVAITKYALILDEYVNSLGDTIPVQHFVYPQDSAPAVVNFGKVPEMMEYYSGIFGEYPFAKYGHAVVQPFWGGMEHQTMTTILRWAAVSGWESGVAHELAHQWWGDMVTCFTWPDIWINEGFATYAEALWVEYEYGTAAYHSNMWEKGFDYFEQDSSQRFAIYDPPQLFNWGIVYCKGAWVLHMLRHIMPSDSVYFAIYPDYGATYEFGNASTADFRSKAEEHYGADLGWYFQEWIYGQGHPQYNYGWNSQDLGGGEYEIEIQIEQIQVDAPPVFEMPIDIRVNTSTIDTVIVVWNDQRFQSFTDTLSLSSPPTGIAFDPDNWILDEHWEVPYGIAEKTHSVRARPNGLRASPNPFRGAVIIALSAGDWGPDQCVEIFDLAGRSVRRMKPETGANCVVWAGLDEAGAPVPGGVYFARSTGSPRTLKLLKLAR